MRHPPVCFQWFENGGQIATGRTASVSLASGTHTIVLRVTLWPRR